MTTKSLLDGATDQMNADIAAAEAALIAAGFATPGEVAFTPAGSTRSWYLAYMKQGGAWRLVVIPRLKETDTLEASMHGAEQLLTHAPRDVRVAAAQALRMLVASLREADRRSLKEVTDASTLYAKIAQELRESK